MDSLTQSAAIAGMSGTILHLRDLAVRALEGMYCPKDCLYAFRLRGTPKGSIVEGLSGRYTATVLIALADESAEIVAKALRGHDPREVCGRLIDRIGGSDDPGEVALTLWAARAWQHEAAPRAQGRMRALIDRLPTSQTVHAAWALSATTYRGRAIDDAELIGELTRRLLTAHHPHSGLFAHWTSGGGPRLRNHICCFADLVYPIQALAHAHRASGDVRLLDAARRCAQAMCSLQGEHGQWWWHYDIRNGRVVERYPVYAVHQDAMAPMALLDLQEAGGDEAATAIARGLAWLCEAPEIGGSLIDAQAGTIWRKVARREPARMARHLQAAASRLHPALRMPGVDRFLPPVAVDWESRPYHMGWILYAWAPGRLRRLGLL